MCIPSACIYVCVFRPNNTTSLYLWELVRSHWCGRSLEIRSAAAESFRFSKESKESDLMNKAQVTLRHTKDIIRCGWRREIQNKKTKFLEGPLPYSSSCFLFSFFTPDGWLLPIWSHGQQQKQEESHTTRILAELESTLRSRNNKNRKTFDTSENQIVLAE